MDVDVVELAPGVFQARAKHVSWVLVTEGDEVTLVDAGFPGDRQRVLASLERIGRSPGDLSAVLLTHGHADHLGCTEALRSAHQVAVHTHELEAANVRGERVEQVGIATVLRAAWRPTVLFWAVDVLRLAGTRPERPTELTTFTDGRLDVPGRPVAVHTPGHTSGHTCFHLPERGVLLAGDALMTEHALSRGHGPRLLPAMFNVDSARARASLERLRDLAASVVVPGHGPAFLGSPALAVHQAMGTS
ncbi:MAG: MBL fold metallo-hydrolase [Actinomycetales bacterium]|nr:MBL fold metallo-hydrolase [Actinomycetales bacterium]